MGHATARRAVTSPPAHTARYRYSRAGAVHGTYMSSTTQYRRSKGDGGGFAKRAELFLGWEASLLRHARSIVLFQRRGLAYVSGHAACIACARLSTRRGVRGRARAYMRTHTPNVLYLFSLYFWGA